MFNVGDRITFKAEHFKFSNAYFSESYVWTISKIEGDILSFTGSNCRAYEYHVELFNGVYPGPHAKVIAKIKYIKAKRERLGYVY